MTVSLPRRAGRVQRVLDDPQVREELLRVTVGQVRVAAAGRGDPPGDEQHRPPVRLARRALGDVDGGFLVTGGEALEERLQRRARRRGDDIEREGPADAVRRALQSEQDVLARDLRGLAGDGCRHERVSVAVAADPRADADEGLDDRRARTRGGPLQGVVDAAVHVRDRGEEGLVEDLHDRSHLVGGRGLLRAQRRGAPQRVDLLDHATLGPSLVGAVAQHDVVLVEQPGQAADAAGDRAPARLGGVRGEHGVEPQRLQACERGVVADLGGEMHERGGDRVGGILPIGAPVALPEDPHPLVLLDEVHEVEVDGERPGDLVGALDAERVGDHRGALERLRGLVGVRLDRRGAQALHVVEQTGGAALAEHTTEQRTQHPHIRAHPLGDLLACFITSDQVDRFGLGELTHASTLSPRCFVEITAATGPR